MKRKRCKVCKELFTPVYSTVQMVCSPKCAFKYAKVHEKEKREHNKEILEKLEKDIRERKTLQTLLKSVQNICHEYIRKRDEGKPCISCGTPWHKDFQAGHFYKAELYSSLKFDEFNIHGQCMQCNLRKEGNLNQYDLNLQKRILRPIYDTLKQKASIDKQNNFKWDIDALKSIREYYRNKLKQLL